MAFCSERRRSRGSLTHLALFFLSACAGGAHDGAIASVPVDTTWYISARARDENGRDTPRLADSLEYGAVLTKRQKGDPLVSRISFDRVATIRFTRAEFVSALRARMESSAAESASSPDSSPFALLYTHGYGTSLRESWQHTATSRIRSRSAQPWVVFAWPSIGSGVSFAGGGNVFLAAYAQDSAAAKASQRAYAQALNAVREATGNGGLVVVAHSLGAQVAGGAIAGDSALRSELRGEPLRAVAFFSPDVDAAQFADSLIPALQGAAQRMLLYATSDDRALAYSASISQAPRAGRFHDDDSPVVLSGLETVDMTDGASADGPLRRAFGPRHALRRRSAALFDLVHIVGPGHAASCRVSLGTAALQESGVWKLTSHALPPTTAVARCDTSQRPLP